MANVRVTGFVNEGGETLNKTPSSTGDSLVSNCHLVPSTNKSSDLGSSTLVWRTVYADQVNATLRHVNTAKYSENSAVRRFVRWNSAGGDGEAGVNNKFIAPANGFLADVVVRASSISNSTTIGFHKASDGTLNLNSVATETQSVNMTAANTSYVAQFTSSTFSAGDILGISLTPSNGFGNVDITVVWMFDWNS